MKIKIPIIILSLLISASCEDSFNLVDSVDGPDGIALAISPVSATIVVDTSMTFAASGGVAPYTFFLSDDSAGQIDEEAGLYTAPSSVGSGTIYVEDSYGARANATVTIISPPDYTVHLGNITSLYNVAGTGFSGTFTVENISPTDGNTVITWVVSVYDVIDITTIQIDDGAFWAVNGSSVSDPMFFSGTWPGSGEFWIRVSVSAEDDIVSINNSEISSNFVISEPDIDYTVDFSPIVQGTEAVGGLISESFTVENRGVNDGSDSVFWIAYISDAETLGAGTDRVIDAGFISPLPAGTVSSDIAFSGYWTAAGDQYLIVSVFADDETGSDYSNETASALYVILP
ncbi:MAG: hypothetical protein JXR86_05715 [Spirochaetales bacterium]|nr:hypothetical protein [Spirochaetales bacterium]